jgi:glycosyltransferase involved in cell wall biosynthesis
LPETEGLKLAGAAYAVLFPADGDTLGTPLLNAWTAGVPAIAISGGRLGEMAGDAALIADMGDPASMATRLMLIYKDENLRRDLIGKGRERLGTFSPEITMETVWDGICKTIEQVSG